MRQGPAFREILREGGSLLSADTRNKHVEKAFLNKGNQEFVASQEGRSLAKKFGMKPLDLYEALSRKSATAMWVVRDAMYMQIIKERQMQGLSLKEAITEVERHMPAYKLPTKVLNSRMLSEVLQNPNVTIFSRYHYGMLKSIMETAKDAAGRPTFKGGFKFNATKEEFLNGVDQAAAIAVAAAILYPMMDIVAQQLTGNKEAETRRAGPYHPMHAIAEIAHGEKDPQALLASVFTFNPALLYLAQLGVDRKLYNGQPIYSPTDDGDIIAKDIWKYTYSQIPQVSSANVTSNPSTGGGWNEWVAKQFDIKSPSGEKVMRREKQKKKQLSASINKRLKEARGSR